MILSKFFISTAKLSLLTLFISSSAHLAHAQAQSSLRPETIEKLNALRIRSRAWAPTCKVSASLDHPAYQYQSHGDCPLGDMAIFSGLACLAGEKERCLDVKYAQGPDGRWWRSPGQIGREEKDSFSRDQGLGVLAYLLATHDTEAALRWQHWIQTEGHGVKMCKESSGPCDLHPGFSNLMGDVWSYLGLPQTPLMKASQVIIPATKELEVSLTPNGYRIHLTAVQLWLRQHLQALNNEGPYFGAGAIAKTIVRKDPENPFYLFLKDGPTEEAARLTLEKCPAQRPTNHFLDWAWQRKDADHAWESASGHDCVFMVNLLLGPDLK